MWTPRYKHVRNPNSPLNAQNKVKIWNRILKPGTPVPERKPVNSVSHLTIGSRGFKIKTPLDWEGNFPSDCGRSRGSQKITR
jgi:hypothetical protein